jgi:hypothetical protein
MATMNILKCGGCGAPLPPDSNVCEFCDCKNIDESVRESGRALNVILVRVGNKPINVIKVIRGITNLGLGEAKALTDNVPSVVKKGINQTKTEDIKRRLEEVGAYVEIRDSSTGLAVYKTHEPLTSEKKGEEEGGKSGPGCFLLSLIILFVVFVMCALVIIFDLDDVLNL